MTSASAVRDVLETAAAIVGALGVLLGALWVVIGPRVRAFVVEASTAAQNANRAALELRTDTPGSTASNAAVAAVQTGRLSRDVAELLARQAALDELRIAERLDLVEVLAEHNSRRVGSVEQALVSWLGSQQLGRPNVHHVHVDNTTPREDPR